MVYLPKMHPQSPNFRNQINNLGWLFGREFALNSTPSHSWRFVMSPVDSGVSKHKAGVAGGGKIYRKYCVQQQNINNDQQPMAKKSCERQIDLPSTNNTIHNNTNDSWNDKKKQPPPCEQGFWHTAAPDKSLSAAFLAQQAALWVPSKACQTNGQRPAEIGADLHVLGRISMQMAYKGVYKPSHRRCSLECRPARQRHNRQFIEPFENWNFEIWKFWEQN